MPVLSIDEFESKRMLEAGLDKWLTLNEGAVRRYAHNNMTLTDTEPFIRKCHKDKELGFKMRLILMQEKKSPKEKLSDILEPFFEKKGQLHIIVGAKRKGKTCLMYMVAKEISKKQEVWMLGPPIDHPDFISGTAVNLEDIPANVTVLIDDAGVQFFSRVHDMENNEVIRMLSVLGHSDKNLILNVQNTAILDLGFVRMCDGVWFKSGSVFQGETERIRIVKQLDMFMPVNIRQVLYYDSGKIYRFEYGLPDWWDEARFSKTYSPFKSEDDMWLFMVRLMPYLDDKNVMEQVKFRGGSIKEKDMMMLRMVGRDMNLEAMKPAQIIRLIKRGYDETPVNIAIKGKYLDKKYRFRMRAGQEEIWRKRFEENPKLETLSNRCVNRLLVKDLKSIVNDAQHVLIQVCDTTGATGTGKSWLGASLSEVIGELIGKKFTARDICFEPEEIAMRVREIKRLGTIEMEEVKVARFGPGSGRSLAEVGNMIQALREAQISFIYTSPEPGPYIYHYRLEMFGIDRKACVSRALLYGPNEIYPLGYVTFLKPSSQLLNDYKKKKHAFMKSIEERTLGSREWIRKMAKKVIDDKRWEICSNQSERRTLITLLYPHLSTAEIGMVKDIATLMEKQEELNEKVNTVAAGSDADSA